MIISNDSKSKQRSIEHFKKLVRETLQFYTQFPKFKNMKIFDSTSRKEVLNYL